MNFIELVVVCALELRRRKRSQPKKRFWLHPVTPNDQAKGSFKNYMTTCELIRKFFSNTYRMSVASFDELLQLIRPHITYKDTNFRKAITAAEKLTVTTSM
nr:unnamed protein product [Callosobruchus chinensis]